jgi:hypothetical protein
MVFLELSRHYRGEARCGPSIIRLSPRLEYRGLEERVEVANIVRIASEGHRHHAGASPSRRRRCCHPYRAVEVSLMFEDGSPSHCGRVEVGAMAGNLAVTEISPVSRRRCRRARSEQGRGGEKGRPGPPVRYWALAWCWADWATPTCACLRA